MGLDECEGCCVCKNLTNLSFWNFVSFNKCLGLLVEGFEKKVESLLRKLVARKGCGVVDLSIRRRPSSASCFEREL